MSIKREKMWACSGYIVVERDECVADVVDGGTKRGKKKRNKCQLQSLWFNKWANMPNSEINILIKIKSRK